MVIEPIYRTEQHEQSEAHFDQWAPHYDEFLKGDEDFPFIGYDRVIDFVVREAHTMEGTRVLELGAGTGNLTERFVDLRCDVWAVDASARMLEEAQFKVDGAHFVHADVLAEWPLELHQQFDCIVSTYLFHEWDMETKVALLQRLANQHLAPDGLIVIGDIAFRSTSALEEAQRRWSRRWDESEYYWAADETVFALMDVDLDVTYTQISSCAGVFVIEPK